MTARVLRRAALAVVMALVLASCGGGISATKNFVYTPPDRAVPLRADAYRPNRAAPVPAVVLLHPTGILGRDLRWTMRGLARRLASRGYFVLNVTFRSAPHGHYPQPMEDMDAALDWIGRNAASQNIDPDRIAVFGYSAGGHLALLTGLADPRVKAVVAGAAPADLTLFEGGRLIRSFAGGTFEEQPDVYYALSPVFWVDVDAPPMFLYHGARDEIVPVEQAHLMKDALDRANVPNELVVLDHKDHVMGFLLSGPAKERAIDFLDRHLRNGEK